MIFRYVLAFLLLVSLGFTSFLNDAEKSKIEGFNLLENPSFIHGSADWSVSTGSFSIVRSGLNSYATWDASASGQTFCTDLQDTPGRLANENGYFYVRVAVPSGTATHTVYVTDGTNKLGNEPTLINSTTPVVTSGNFIFETVSDDLQLCIESQADEPSVSVYSGFIGEARNLTQYASAEKVGSINWAGATNCTWSSSNNNNFTDYGADADCSTPTVTGILTDPGNNKPEFSMDAGPGEYFFVARGIFNNSATAVSCGFRFSDGTNATATNGVFENSGTIYVPTINGSLTYTTAGSRTINIQASGIGAAAGCSVINTTSLTDLEIDVYRYPLTSELAVKADQSAASWSGYHDSTCSWSRTNTAIGDPAADASCALSELTNTNFGTVSTSGSVLPAITFTPNKTQKYFACASFYITSASVAQATAQILDGSTIVAQNAVSVAVTNTAAGFNLCGIVEGTVGTSKTLKVQYAIASGTGTISSVSPQTRAVEWSIFSIDSTLPAPLIKNSVVSSSSGVTGVESAFIEVSTASTPGTPEVGRETTGDWIDDAGFTDNGNGDTTITINSGIFSAAPDCSCIGHNSSNMIACVVDTTTAISSTTIRIQTAVSNTGAAGDSDFSLICVGPR